MMSNIELLFSDEERVLRVMENDLILKHDCIWPHGLNFQLHIDSLLEVSEFRKSCLRHQWPPEAEVDDEEISLPRLRRQIEIQDEGVMPEVPPEALDTPKKTKRRSKEDMVRPAWENIIDDPPKAAHTNGDRKARGEAFVIPAVDPEPLERPDSPKSDVSTSTFVIPKPDIAPPAELQMAAATATPTHAHGPKSPTKQTTSRPTTPARKTPRATGIKPLSAPLKKKQVSTPRSDGIDRVSSTTSLISSSEMSPARAKPKVKEKDTNAPATPRKSPSTSPEDMVDKGEKQQKDEFENDSLERSSPTPSNSSGCTYSVEMESMPRTPSTTSLNSTSESKENEKQEKPEKQLKKRPTSAIKKRESLTRSPRTARPTSARGVPKTKGSDVKGSDVTKSHSRLPVAASGGGGRHSPSHR